MDDITVIARGYDHRYTIPFFHEQLATAKKWLTKNNMVMNEKGRADLCEQRKIQKIMGKLIPRLPRRTGRAM